LTHAGVRRAAYIGGVLGLGLFLALLVRANLADLLHTLRVGGLQLLWLLPYRLLFFILYALGWAVLLHPYDARGQAMLPFLTWVATVREGIDRLLPVASIGGGIVGIRLLGWRGIALSSGAASVIAEVLLTLVALSVFSLIGLTLLAIGHAGVPAAAVAVLVVGAAVPTGLAVALRSGRVFTRLQRALQRFVGVRRLGIPARDLDARIQTTLRQGKKLLASGLLQLAAMVSGVFEVWFALQLFGHPLDLRSSFIVESLTQAARHAAFFIPGALGVQEGALIALGASMGLSSELALAVSLVKRARELAWGIPALVSWQWEEGRRVIRRRHP
jgi:putative membrane protein